MTVDQHITIGMIWLVSTTRNSLGPLLSSSCDSESRFGECHLCPRAERSSALSEGSDATFPVRRIRLQRESGLLCPGRESGVLCSKSERWLLACARRRDRVRQRVFRSRWERSHIFWGRVFRGPEWLLLEGSGGKKKLTGHEHFGLWNAHSPSPLLVLQKRRGPLDSIAARNFAEALELNRHTRFWRKNRPGKILVYFQSFKICSTDAQLLTNVKFCLAVT